MNPLLLLLLVGGGTYAAVKTVQAIRGSSEPETCVTNLLTPPTNPYFSKVQGKFTVDYQAVADALQAKSKTEKGKRDAKLAEYAGTAAAVAALIPGIGTAGAGIILAAAAVAGVAMKAWDWLSGDDNSDEYKQRVIDYADRVIQWGYIPPSPNQNMSMRQTANGLAVDLVAIESTDPYVSWLFKTAGALFVKWGGEDHVLELAAPYVVGEKVSEGTFPPPAACWDEKAWAESVKQNAGRMSMFAYCIALEYGVQAKADQVIAAAINGSKDWKSVFPFYAGISKDCLEDITRVPGFGTSIDRHSELYTNPSSSCYGATPGFVSFLKFSSLGGAIDLTCPYYSFAAGIYEAIKVASKLACKAPPPPMTIENVVKGPKDDAAFMAQDNYDYSAAEAAAKKKAADAKKIADNKKSAKVTSLSQLANRKTVDR